MTKTIKTTGPKAPRIQSTSPPAALVAPQHVANVLGAEHVMAVPTSGSPPALLELRRQLFALLKSSGGRPGLEGADLRPKIPMRPEDWNRLEEVARQLAGDGFAPTAAQVGAQLLHNALARLQSESHPGSVPYPRASRASEPTATYSPSSASRPSSAQQAAQRHLQQAQDVGVSRAANSVRDRRITQLSIENLELLFAQPGLPIVDKGAPSPTTSIAILGEAGAGKTTLAVSLAQAIAADANGLALYLTTELAPTEIKYKISLLGVNAAVVTWHHRATAQAGDIIGQHVALLEGADDAPIRKRALEAAWRLIDATVIEPPIRCVVIDAFPIPEPSNSSARDEVVTLIQALEGRGVSVVIVQEAGGMTDFVPFVADVVFQLRFAEDADTGGWLRKLGCPKSRYARVLAGPHATGVDRDRVKVWPAPLLVEGRKQAGASRR